MSSVDTDVMPPFYNNVVPLSSERHKGWSFEKVKDYRFTEKANLVYLSCVEFRKASREFPVVFVGSEAEVIPAALLGIHASENLFLKENGEWDSSYIPAYVRRYPFIAANIDDNTDRLLLSVDEGYSGLNQEGRGERLYSESGEQTDYIKGISTFLSNFQVEHTRTTRFCEHLVAYGLLEPMTAKVTVSGEKPIILKGFYVVSYAKLKALTPENLAKLLQEDELGLVFSHLSSLDQFEPLVARARQE